MTLGYQHGLALKSDGRVVAWGDNLYGQANVPPGLSNAVAISGGCDHSLALTSDGRVVGWGYNEYGQTSPPAGLTNVLAIAAGGYHSLALKSENPLAISVAGVGLDGYVAYAAVFFDANRSGEQDGNEPGTNTDAQGHFAFQMSLGEFDANYNGRLDPTEGCLVLKGGLDIATGQPLRTALTAPAGSTVVSPLTTLLQEALDQSPGLSVSNSQEHLRAALGISNQVDLTRSRPICWSPRE